MSIIYANEADVLNVALFGMTAKEWRETNPDLKGNIRDYAVVAENGNTATRVKASGGRVKLNRQKAGGLVEIILERPDNGEVTWQLGFEPAK